MHFNFSHKFINTYLIRIGHCIQWNLWGFYLEVIKGNSDKSETLGKRSERCWQSSAVCSLAFLVDVGVGESVAVPFLKEEVLGRGSRGEGWRWFSLRNQ